VSRPAIEGAIQGAEAAQGAASDWRAVRDSAAIQFAADPAPARSRPPETPDWLKSLGEALGNICFEPARQGAGPVVARAAMG
jgi:hypothetical protein